MSIRRIAVFAAGIVLLAYFAVCFFTCIINYDESAIITTFGAASQQSVKNADGSQSGIFFRLPWPIQEVIRFDRRISIVEDRLEQQETKDRKVIVVKAYMIWRIGSPLEFYRAFRTSKRAETFLLERLRASKSELGLFTFDDLANADSQLLRIDDANRALRDRIQRELASYESGILVLDAGINRILLPENITKSVFQRMRQTRQRMAQNVRSEGNAVAQSIIAKTDSDKKRIMAFAEMAAQRLRAEGDAAAARYYKEYAKSPEFAIFLKKLDSFKASLRENTTFILDTDMEPFDLLDEIK